MTEVVDTRNSRSTGANIDVVQPLIFKMIQTCEAETALKTFYFYPSFCSAHTESESAL